MLELSTKQYQSARPLFRDQEDSHALVTALFDGDLSARLFVDNETHPHTGVIIYNSRVLFGGDASGQDFNTDVKHIFSNQLIPEHKAKGNDAYLICFSNEAWKPMLETIFSDYKLYNGLRRYYEIDQYSPAEINIPEGVSFHWVDQNFLDENISGMDMIREEMCSERLSVQDFLDHSFGLCPVIDHEITGWCLSEYNTGARCEIGIATMEKHQRKGIATLSVHAFLAEAHRRGYNRVGWDCWGNNIASVSTALKAGLKLKVEYPALVLVFDQ